MAILILRKGARARAILLNCRPAGKALARQSSTSSSRDKLNILFCGSDSFSIQSLKALHQLHIEEPSIVDSINVVCRPPKPTGRGLTTLRESPMKPAAEELSLPVHEIDTFTGWQPPTPNGLPINLIIAVSFGLLVPPRLLNGAKYGGLNVHPSILPMLRGPAPIERTLLANMTHTGVTLQTLDATTFDAGLILDQTPAPGFPIDNPLTCTRGQLLEQVSRLAAEMLVRGVRSGLYIPPLTPVHSTKNKEHIPQHLAYAPKITPEDRHIKWAEWTSTELFCRQRVLKDLWSLAPAQPRAERLIMGEILRVTIPELDLDRIPIGIPFAHQEALRPEPGKVATTQAIPFASLFVRMCDDVVVSVQMIKRESRQFGAAVPLAKRLGLLTGKEVVDSSVGPYVLFHSPLE